MAAIFNNNIWIVRELLLAGASVNDKGDFGSSAYDVALWVYAAGLQIEPEVVGYI